MQFTDFTPLGVCKLFEKLFLNVVPIFNERNIIINRYEVVCAWENCFLASTPSPEIKRLMQLDGLKYYDPDEMAEQVLYIQERLQLYSNLEKSDPLWPVPPSDGDIVQIPSYLIDWDIDFIETLCDILSIKHEKFECISKFLYLNS